MPGGVKDRTTAELNRRLENWIEQRTWGRVYRLHVESNKSRVIVHGRASTYYICQLALAAALEALETETVAKPKQVEVAIEVGV